MLQTVTHYTCKKEYKSIFYKDKGKLNMRKKYLNLFISSENMWALFHCIFLR